jgi:hypothetical protein
MTIVQASNVGARMSNILPRPRHRYYGYREVIEAKQGHEDVSRTVQERVPEMHLGCRQGVGICGNGRINCAVRKNLVGGRVLAYSGRLPIGCKPRKV